MPVYDKLPTIEWYPSPEARRRILFKDLELTSVLDVGAGHGGVFDMDGWNSPKVTHREACDIFAVKPLPPQWHVQTGVDVTRLHEWYSEGEFDYVQCTEVLEHVERSMVALQELLFVAKKVVFITSCDEMHHQGPEQEAIEKINKHQRYIRQPRVEDLLELGFEVRVESQVRRQIIAWKIL